MRFRTIAHPPDKKRRLEKRERKRRQSLDGDGSWRRTSGERRERTRRASDQDESAIIHLPFLDDEWNSTDEKSTDQDESTNDAHTVNSATTESAYPAQDSVQQTSNDAAKEESGEMDDSNTPKILSAEEQARLESLKGMLDASNARYKQASRNRRPVFAAGLKVKVVNGDHTGKTGVVLDADYIANRALISLADQDSPRWIGFRSLGHPD